MLMYISKRLLRSLLTLFIILTIVFILLRQMPIEGYFPNFDKMSKLQIESGLHQMGLDQPMPVQLGRMFKNLLQGDLGTSRIYR
ncbi:MAG: ABC transporter permease, partial [Bacillota bacterium]|nr:ABC transporter permease [Bacillota bacterium]